MTWFKDPVTIEIKGLIINPTVKKLDCGWYVHTVEIEPIGEMKIIHSDGTTETYEVATHEEGVKA